MELKIVVITGCRVQLTLLLHGHIAGSRCQCPTVSTTRWKKAQDRHTRTPRLNLGTTCIHRLDFTVQCSSEILKFTLIPDKTMSAQLYVQMKWKTLSRKSSFVTVNWVQISELDEILTGIFRKTFAINLFVTAFLTYRERTITKSKQWFHLSYCFHGIFTGFSFGLLQKFREDVAWGRFQKLHGKGFAASLFRILNFSSKIVGIANGFALQESRSSADDVVILPLITSYISGHNDL